MGLDYNNTCPDIDKQIKSAKESMQSHFYAVLEEACPLLHNIAKTELSKDYAAALYNDIESCFELVRKSNSDMRDAADLQINNLVDEIDDLESEIDQLEAQLAESR